MIAAAILAARGMAQTPARPPRMVPEARLDAFFARRTTIHAGAGADIYVGRHVQLELVVAGGSAFDNGVSRRSGRFDLIARFAPLPTSPRRWGAYAGGGLSARVEESARGNAFVTVLAGAEAPRTWRARPFVDLGYGGGVRVGAGVRRGWPGRG